MGIKLYMLKEIFQGVTKIVYTVVFFMGLVNVFLATKKSREGACTGFACGSSGTIHKWIYV